MSTDTHRQIANDIWSICNLLRGPYKRNEYRKVILPLTVLRRFDGLLAPTKAKALETFNRYKGKPESIIRSVMQGATGYPFYNLSKLEFRPSQKGVNSLLDDPSHLAQNLNSYINGFSPNVRAIMERFAFDQQIARMAEKNILFKVVQKFATFDLSFSHLAADQAAMQMGYVFEELIRIGAEQSNEEAGEHFTPREVIKLMVNLLLSPEQDLRRSHVVKTIYDPACGTGGMLSVAEKYIRDLNSDANPLLYGQDWNDEAWAVCRADMLIKGEDADNIARGDTFTKDAHARDEQGQKRRFDYMLANPPFGVEWKQQQRYIEDEAAKLGYQGRFGAGTPRINDGALLFLQHMIDKMRAPHEGGSRIGIVFNGSPLFTGDAGGGESEIRRWIIENDWLEAIVALPEQLFYNTGISTYIWVLTNRKEAHRKGKVQLIDARNHWVPMEKSLGNKRRRIGDPGDKPKDPDHIADITGLHGQFTEGSTRWVLFDKDGKVVDLRATAPTESAPDGQTWKSLVVSKVFDNEDFGYNKITVERPLRLNFQATPQRIARLDDESAFKNLATSAKKDEAARLADIQLGEPSLPSIRAAARAGLCFRPRDVADRLQQPVMVEPGDPFHPAVPGKHRSRMTSNVIDPPPAPPDHARTHNKGVHMQTNIETIVDSHLAAYCEPDGPSRMKTIAQVWNAQGRLVDPPFESAGHQGIAEQAAALIQQFPGHRFVRTTGVDGHHEFARYGWALRDGLGNSVMEGVDFVTLDGDGRILMVVGFFGPQERRAEG